MKCLVTGGAGFLGSHLCEALVARGDEVHIIDNVKGGRPAITPRECFFHEYDVSYTWPNYPSLDVIFHLAAKADIVPSIKNPISYHETNVNGTLNMLQLAKRCGAKFIYAASSSCYGIPEEYPTTELAECNPQYPYALTKYVGEQYVQHWAKIYKVPAISLRLFNVYGPRHRTSGAYGAVFGTFLSQLANDKAITIVGDGTQSRDFTYISDVVRAFIQAAESTQSGGVYNVGSGQPHSINYLGDLLGAKNRKGIPKRPGEPDITFADITKIKKELNWEPKVSFEEGVAIMKKLIPTYKDAPLWTADSIAIETKAWFEALG